MSYTIRYLYEQHDDESENVDFSFSLIVLLLRLHEQFMCFPSSFHSLIWGGGGTWWLLLEMIYFVDMDTIQSNTCQNVNRQNTNYFKIIVSVSVFCDLYNIT